MFLSLCLPVVSVFLFGGKKQAILIVAPAFCNVLQYHPCWQVLYFNMKRHLSFLPPVMYMLSSVTTTCHVHVILSYHHLPCMCYPRLPPPAMCVLSSVTTSCHVCVILSYHLLPCVCYPWLPPPAMCVLSSVTTSCHVCVILGYHLLPCVCYPVTTSCNVLSSVTTSCNVCVNLGYHLLPCVCYHPLIVSANKIKLT